MDPGFIVFAKHNAHEMGRSKDAKVPETVSVQRYKAVTRPTLWCSSSFLVSAFVFRLRLQHAVNAIHPRQVSSNDEFRHCRVVRIFHGDRLSHKPVLSR